MTKKGRKLTEEHKRRIGEANKIALKGNVPWNKGKTKKDFPQMANSGVKKGNVPWSKGTKGIFKSNSGSFKKGQKTKNWNGFKKGHIVWNKGIPWNKEVREKLSKAQKKRFEEITNHPMWKGGVSFEPYTTEFNRKLKDIILERDGYVCQECGKTEEELGQKQDIHHIDYNKENCAEDNLISLCRSCNAKANQNRQYWTKRFTEILVNRDKMNKKIKWQKCPKCGKKTSDDKQFCQHCLYNVGLHYTPFSVSISYKPGWVDAFNRVNPHPEAMDAEGERIAADVMTETREKEMRGSSKAANWERGRKVAFRKNVAYDKARKRKHQQKVDQAKSIAVNYLEKKANERKAE